MRKTGEIRRASVSRPESGLQFAVRSARECGVRGAGEPRTPEHERKSVRTEPRRNRTIGPLPGAGTRRRRACRFVLGAAVALALSCLGGGPALATDPAPDVAVSGGITAIGQVTTGGGADASLTGSLDVFVTVARRWGSFELYVEGNSTPREGGVAALVPEANGDAGSALDERDRGRLQVSELKLDLRLPGERSVAVGLVDLSAYLDATRISNDENLQFLSAPLINNPAIEFPDYTLGIVFRQPATGGVPAIHAAVTSSNGLADNPGKSYSELFDVGDDGKGVFAALEAAWKPGNRPVRVGVWWSGRDHDTLRGGSTERSNAGAWAPSASPCGARHSTCGSARPTRTSRRATASRRWRTGWSGTL